MNLIRRQHTCPHSSVSTTPGTRVYGLHRATCDQCKQVFLRRTDVAGSGEPFRNGSESPRTVNGAERLAEAPV